MQRVTITLDEEFVTELDRVIETRGYQNRSEAIRDLAKRLTHVVHDHHDLSLSAMHVHLDHGSCMEVAVRKGEAKQVRHLADHVIAERGVRHGRLVMVPVDEEAEKHTHTGAPGHKHLHLHVRKAG